MRLHVFCAAIAAFACSGPAAADTPPGTTTAPLKAERKVITSVDQLPKRSYPIARLPSALLDAPKAELDAVVNAVDKDFASDFDTLDIRDRTTLVAILQARGQFAIHRGDFASAREILLVIRAQQESAAEKLTAGVTMEEIIDTRMKGGPLDKQRARLREALAARWGAMPFAVVGANLRSAKSGLEQISKDAVVSGMKSQVDPVAQGMNLRVPAAMIVAIVSNRTVFEQIMPFRDDIVAVLQGILDRNR